MGDSVHKLMTIVMESLDKSSPHREVSTERLEAIVFLLYGSLKLQGRFFHSVEHAISLVREGHAELSLAALFHDLVYYQIDGGLPDEIAELLTPYIIERPDQRSASGVYLREVLPDDELTRANLALFNFKEGQELCLFHGLNELLSSLVMCATLSDLLPIKSLIKMITYLEATIPFRGAHQGALSESKAGPFELLERRLRSLNSERALGFSEEELQETIREAVWISNQDVLNFSEPDVRDFLDNTWDLIPETNLSLRRSGLYTVRDYRFAIQKMCSFFEMLNPASVFHQHLGEPKDERFDELNERAASNISIAKRYLRVKLLTASILEAFALSTGGDCPISFLMGELPREGHDPKRLEHHLPLIEPSVAAERAALDPDVWLLLDKGRNRESVFDLKRAPLALLVYTQCSVDELDELTHRARGVHQGDLSPAELLDALPRALRVAIAQGLWEMAPSRRAQLERLISA